MDEFDNFLNYHKPLFKGGDMSADQVLQNLVSKLVISTAGIEQNNPKHAWLYEALNSALGSKVKTRNEKFNIGIFVECLIEHGSSRLQAVKATAQWLGISESKARQANEFSRQETVTRTTATKEVKLFCASQVMSGLSKDFPTDYPKAFQAYSAFKARALLT